MRRLNGVTQFKDHCEGKKHQKFTKKFRWGRPKTVEAKSDFKGSAEDRRIAINMLEHIIKDLEDSTDPDFVHTGIFLQ